MPELPTRKPRCLMSASEIFEENCKRMCNTNTVKRFNNNLSSVLHIFPVGIRKTAMEVEMMQQERMLHEFYGAFNLGPILAICGPARPEPLTRKHVDCQVVAPKQLCGETKK